MLLVLPAHGEKTCCPALSRVRAVRFCGVSSVSSAAGSCRLRSTSCSKTARLTKINLATSLALPDVLATGTGDRLRWMFLCQRLPTNWAIFAPHIHTCLSLTKGSDSKITVKGRSSPVCSNWNRNKSVPSCIGAPFSMR